MVPILIFILIVILVSILLFRGRRSENDSQTTVTSETAAIATLGPPLAPASQIK